MTAANSPVNKQPKPTKKPIIYLTLISIFFIGLLCVGGILAKNVYSVYHDPIIPENQSIYFLLKPGQSLGDLTAFLVKRGYLKYPKTFLYLAKWQNLNTQIKAGEYVFKANSTAWYILLQLARGQVVIHHIRFIEGWRFQQFINLLANTKNIKHELTSTDPTIVMQQLGLAGQPYEGEFFPSTYQYVLGSSDKEILLTAYQTMQRLLTIAWQQRATNLPYTSSYQALIVASLVEKETGLASERRLIAGVIVKRLQKNMYLQVDPTVIYGLGNAYDGMLTKQQLEQTTPYNTYKIKGLPPTPIAAPGAASIAAAMHPKITDALFYVATGYGGHYFSATLAEHDVAIGKYLAAEAKQLSKQTLPLQEPTTICDQTKVPAKYQSFCQPCWYVPNTLKFICSAQNNE